MEVSPLALAAGSVRGSAPKGPALTAGVTVYVSGLAAVRVTTGWMLLVSVSTTSHRVVAPGRSPSPPWQVTDLGGWPASVSRLAMSF